MNLGRTGTQRSDHIAGLSFKSIEFCEGVQAYADGVDGHAATPYTEGSQEMTDWFAGWLAAREADRAEAAA